MPVYKAPPIVEAIIEVRFHNEASEGALDKARLALAKNYPFVDENKSAHYHIDTQSKNVRVQNLPSGFRFMSADGADVCAINRVSFSSLRNAPYDGWDSFFNRFKRDYENFRNKIGVNKISRVGMRYINRIDVPTLSFSPSEYLNIFVMFPSEFRSTVDFSFRLKIPGIGSSFSTVGCATVPSPVIGTTSVLLDIDVSEEVETPKSDADLFELLLALRAEKNRVFEACITEKTRGMYIQ